MEDVQPLTCVYNQDSSWKELDLGATYEDWKEETDSDQLYVKTQGSSDQENVDRNGEEYED